MVVPVPGGYGVGDASLAGMLSVVGLGLAQATLVALAHRSASTLVRTAIGFGVLGVRYPHLLTVPFEAVGALARRLTPGRGERTPLSLPLTTPARPAEVTVDLPGIGD